MAGPAACGLFSWLADGCLALSSYDLSSVRAALVLLSVFTLPLFTSTAIKL